MSKWILYDKLKFLKKLCIQTESLSKLQTFLNTSYFDKTESLTKNIVTKETIKSSKNIEYLENEDIDAVQLYLYNSQEKYIIPTDALENKICNSSNLPATVHSYASLKSTSSKFRTTKKTCI